MDVLSLLQWPAMVVTLIAAWLVASQSRARRNWGFWTFILSNVLWMVWGWHEGAIALIVLQVGLFVSKLAGGEEERAWGRGEHALTGSVHCYRERGPASSLRAVLRARA